MRLTLTGLGGPLHLRAAQASGAIAASFAPITVEFAQDVTVDLTLAYPNVPPGIIALMLDFGVAGTGVVTVIPVPE